MIYLFINILWTESIIDMSETEKETPIVSKIKCLQLVFLHSEKRLALALNSSYVLTLIHRF